MKTSIKHLAGRNEGNEFESLPNAAKPKNAGSFQTSPKEREGKRRKSNFGSAAGLVEVADDFDEPLADFGEYM